MVLLAGVVVALALIAMLVAYMQLGYHADVTSAGVDENAVGDGQSYLERTTHDTARALRGEYAWSERGQAVTAARNRIEPQLAELQRANVESGRAVTVTFNQTVAQRWTNRNCPGGRGREFGSCEVDRSVVVQERDGRTLVLAVGYDLEVTTDSERSRLSLVVESVD
jgi:uncharacterized iron-regulated membrane protein